MIFLLLIPDQTNSMSVSFQKENEYGLASHLRIGSTHSFNFYHEGKNTLITRNMIIYFRILKGSNIAS